MYFPTKSLSRKRESFLKKNNIKHIIIIIFNQNKSNKITKFNIYYICCFFYLNKKKLKISISFINNKPSNGEEKKSLFNFKKSKPKNKHDF